MSFVGDIEVGQALVKPRHRFILNMVGLSEILRGVVFNLDRNTSQDGGALCTKALVLV